VEWQSREVTGCVKNERYFFLWRFGGGNGLSKEEKIFARYPGRNGRHVSL
jgi:hypothetical protein